MPTDWRTLASDIFGQAIRDYHAGGQAGLQRAVAEAERALNGALTLFLKERGIVPPPWWEVPFFTFRQLLDRFTSHLGLDALSGRQLEELHRRLRNPTKELGTPEAAATRSYIEKILEWFKLMSIDVGQLESLLANPSPDTTTSRMRDIPSLELITQAFKAGWGDDRQALATFESDIGMTGRSVANVLAMETISDAFAIGRNMSSEPRRSIVSACSIVLSHVLADDGRSALVSYYSARLLFGTPCTEVIRRQMQYLCGRGSDWRSMEYERFFEMFIEIEYEKLMPDGDDCLRLDDL